MGFFRDLFVPKDIGDFWGGYKLTHPDEARAIETITGENFSLLSNKDAREKYTSLERLADNNNCSIIHVKDAFLSSFMVEFGGNEEVLRQAIPMITEKMAEEALRYNISKNNTSSFYMRKWLLEIVGNPFE